MVNPVVYCGLFKMVSKINSDSKGQIMNNLWGIRQSKAVSTAVINTTIGLPTLWLESAAF